MFGKLIAIDVVKVGGRSLIYGFVEWDTVSVGGDDILHGFCVGVRHSVLIDYEGRLIIEQGLANDFRFVSSDWLFSLS